MNREYMQAGMERMLTYHNQIHKDERLKQACGHCDHFMGKVHDYHECKQCAVFQMYCELQQYHFVDTFRYGGYY